MESYNEQTKVIENLKAVLESKSNLGYQVCHGQSRHFELAGIEDLEQVKMWSGMKRLQVKNLELKGFLPVAVFQDLHADSSSPSPAQLE